jgi:lipoate-protein ligase A
VSAEVLDRAERDPAANLAFEEALFGELRRNPRALCLFYVNDPCVVLGRNNRAEEWVELDAALADGLPLLRRFSGGGAVYHDHDCLNFSFIVPKRMIERLGHADGGTGLSRYLDHFRGIVLRALSRGGGGFSLTGLSDVSLNERKVSGSAERIAANLVLHHGTVLMRCPLAAIERYLRVPPDRPGVPHAGFVSGLAEEGLVVSLKQLKRWLADEFALTLSRGSQAV